MRKTCILTLLGIVTAAMVASDWLVPSGAEGQQSRSLDDQLLEDLGADPLDELDRELLGPTDKPDRAERELADQLRRELGAAAEDENESPLLEVARQMREVEGLIAENDSGDTTRSLQQQVVADLDELIRQARKRCAQCKPGDKPPRGSSRRQVTRPSLKPGSGGNRAGNKPAQNGNAKPGQGEAQKPDAEQIQQLIKQLWGQLPQRDRERMIQSPPEEFLPKYESMIEEYYRRLSEGNQP